MLKKFSSQFKNTVDVQVCYEYNFYEQFSTRMRIEELLAIAEIGLVYDDHIATWATVKRVYAKIHGNSFSFVIQLSAKEI